MKLVKVGVVEAKWRQNTRHYHRYDSFFYNFSNQSLTIVTQTPATTYKTDARHEYGMK